MFKRFFKILRLASRDYAHEWQMSICFVLALAAVLGPMLVLFGLKFGIIGGMVQTLVEDPHNREIRPIGSGRYSQQWLDALAAKDAVDFLVPRTRSIAASIELQGPTNQRILRVELIPSAAGDPLLPSGMRPPMGSATLILSTNAASKLGVQAGDTLDGSVARRFRGNKERAHLQLTVSAIAPPGAFPRDGAFVSVQLLNALEDYRDGRAVPALGWTGSAPTEGARSYPGFRLYARSIYDVEGLKRGFEKRGIEVRTQAADIALVQRMDHNLSTIYWAIAVIGLVGFGLSLGASLWANVDRKRRDLAILRLVGFHTGDITWFPVLQSLYTALLGWLLALGIYQGAAWVINDMLAAQLSPGQDVCVMLPEHYAISLALTLTVAVIAATLAGWRSARIAPSDGLREI